MTIKSCVLLVDSGTSVKRASLSHKSIASSKVMMPLALPDIHMPNFLSRGVHECVFKALERELILV